MTDQTEVKFRAPGLAEKKRDRIPCLVVVEGNDIGEVFRVLKPSMLIGRSDKAEIFLQDDGISRQHARVDRHENAYTLTDLDSTNGTFVNGDQIQQSTLRDGDKVRIGEVLLRFGFQDSIEVSYQEKLRSMAMRDGLTKIFNRRYFLEMLEREFSYAMRQRLPLTIIFFDIDHFKQVNDSHGHQAGDAVLRSVADALKTEVRGYDILARYGGEEFSILLRATALDNALFLAGRIRKLVEALSVDFEQKKLQVTISLGVASLNPDQARTPGDLVKEADRYLYDAKEKGRNRVCSVRTKD